MKANKRTRVISFLLTLVMLVGMLPLSAVPVSAAVKGTAENPYLVESYDILQNWIKTCVSANETAYFKLANNLEYIQKWNDAIKIDIDNGKKIFLDVAGYDIYIRQETDGPALPYMFRVTGGSTLTIDDSTYCQNSRNWICASFTDDKKSHNLIRVEDNSRVVINGGNFEKRYTLEADNQYMKTDMPNGAIVADKTSEIIINGGTVKGPNYALEDRITEYLYRRNSAIASYGKLTINGGEFIGDVGIIGLPDGNDVAVTINGGVFNNRVQVDAALTASNTFSPRIAIYGGDFKDRFVVNPGIKGISVSKKFYIPILLRGGTFSSLVTVYNKDKYSSHDCMAISLYDTTQDDLVGPDATAARMNRDALAACIGDSVVYIRRFSDEYKYKDIFTQNYYITKKNMNAVGQYPNIGYMIADGGYVQIFPDSFGLKEVLLDNNTVEKPKHIDDGASFISGNVPFYSVSGLGYHLLTFRWYDLPQEMKDAGYSYKVTFQTQSVTEFVVSSSSIITKATSGGTVNEWSYTIPKTHTTTQQATFRLDLMKDGETVNDTATHNDYLLMYRVAENTKTHIDRVDLNISAPLIEGDKTSGTVSVSGSAGYTISKQTVWQGDETYEDLNNNNNYPANLKTKYYKGITLEAKDGFAFDSSAKPIVNITGLASDYDSYYVRVLNESTAIISLYSYPTPIITNATGTVQGLHKDNYVRDITVEPQVSREYTLEVLKILRISSNGEELIASPGDRIDSDSTYRIYLTAHAKWGYAFKEGDPVYDVDRDVYTHSKITLRTETDPANYFNRSTTYGKIPYTSEKTSYISPDLEVDVSCRHNNVTYVPYLGATCMTTGHLAYTQCDDCGAIVKGSNEVISKCYHGYNEEDDYVFFKNSTHDEDGMDAHYVCNTPGCDQYFDKFGNETTKEALTIPKHQSDGIWQNDGTKHWQNCEYSWCGKKVNEGEHISTGANVATCRKLAKCDICGVTYGEVSSHNFDSAWSTSMDSHYHKCLNDDCPARYGQGLHTFTAAVKKTEALKTSGTNTGEAVYYYSCSVCGRVEKNDSHTFKESEAANGYVSGSVVSFLNDTDTVTIQLIEQGHSEVAYETTVTGGTLTGSKYTAAYSFSQVPAGTYTMKVSKANHVTREYTVTVGASAVTQDVQINLLGDVTGDGKVNVKDWGKVKDHMNESITLTGYEFSCADVTQDGKVNVKDWNRMKAHINETDLLW